MNDFTCHLYEPVAFDDPAHWELFAETLDRFILRLVETTRDPFRRPSVLV